MEIFIDIFSKKYNLNSKDAAALLALMEPSATVVVKYWYTKANSTPRSI